MSLGVSGAAIPPLAGSRALVNWMEWVCPAGYGNANYNVAWAGFGFTRSTPGTWSAGNLAAVWRQLGSVNIFVRPLAGFGLVLEVLPAIAAGGAREVFQIFSPHPSVAYAMDFLGTWPPSLELAPAVQPFLAASVSAWIRKRVGGDAIGARQFFGFSNAVDQNWSRRIARVGVMGDGAGGFRFGSVNCPAAPAGGVENAQNDIDANSVQPSVLVAPGTNWFHVRVKMIPPTDTIGARFLCFLNGRLAATFANVNNFPRSSRSSIDVAEIDYWPIMPTIAAWGNPDGVSQDPGYYLRDVRVRLEEDWSDAQI